MKIKSHNNYCRADFLALLLNLAIYHSNFDSVISILGNPGATSRDDAIFSGERLL